MAKIPSSIEIPSKIKNIYIEISGYNFNHGTSNFGYFVGRTDVLNRLKALLTNTSFSGGSYLITGYRGMGKTTLVEKALSDINLQKKGNKYVKIDISLSQDDIKDVDVLRYISSTLCIKWFEMKKQLNIDDNNLEWKEVSSFLIEFSKKISYDIKKYKTDSYSEEDKGNSSDSVQKSEIGSEMFLTKSSSKEIEKDLIYILDKIDNIRKKIVKFLCLSLYLMRWTKLSLITFFSMIQI